MDCGCKIFFGNNISCGLGTMLSMVGFRVSAVIILMHMACCNAFEVWYLYCHMWCGAGLNTGLV